METKYKFILYLDMDGVLTSEDYIIKIHNLLINKNNVDKNFRYRNFMQSYCFQSEAVDCLNRLYDKIPYTIILSSTRRFEFNLTEWNLIFRLNKIKAYIGGRTNSLINHWRGDEIRDYQFKEYGMFTFKHLPFIIIDDDSFDLMKFKNKLIHVNTKTGLTLAYYNEIIEKLKKQGVDINE